MTDRAALRGTIDIRLVTDAQLQAVEAGDDENQGLTSELRLKAPAQRGLIVATALVAHPGDRQEAERSRQSHHLPSGADHHGGALARSPVRLRRVWRRSSWIGRRRGLVARRGGVTLARAVPQAPSSARSAHP